MKHTPGPWKSDEHGCLMAGDVQIAAIFPHNREANTPLFEAAPEMLELLKALVDADSHAPYGNRLAAFERVEELAEQLLAKVEDKD